METRSILAFGALNVDEIYRIEWDKVARFFGNDLPRGGERILRAKRVRDVEDWLSQEGKLLGKYPGGSASNTAAALAGLKVPAALFGRVGDDEAGRFLIGSAPAVDTSRVQVGGETGRCFILVDGGGERTILLMPGANDEVEIPAAVPEPAGGWEGIYLTSIVHNDGPLLQRTLLDRVGPVPIIGLDPGEIYAIRGREALNPILEKSTHLFLTQRESSLLLGDSPTLDLLMTPPRRMVMIKKGDQGLEVITPAERVAVPPFPVKAVDSTGSGDAAAAGYLAAELADWSLYRRALLAARCGAVAATAPGREAYPETDIMDQIEAEPWPSE